MPLDKSGSKKAFSKNVATERAAGKSPKQSVAIAYAVQRRGHSPDRFDDTSVVGETPDRREYHDHQENLDPQTVAAVEFRQNRPIRESWTGMPPKGKNS